MIEGIFDTRSIHGVKTPAEYATRHQEQVRKLQRRGVQVEVTQVDAPVAARIDHNRWLLDCVCGSGVAAHPSWPESRCFGCGLVYITVVFPADREAIEAVLIERPSHAVRNWDPRKGDTVDILKAENLHGRDLTIEERARAAEIIATHPRKGAR